MVKSSSRCYLKDLTPAQLIERGEHENEWGGYFILKGHERLIRMLLVVRRNYPIAIIRRSWKQRGALFSEKGILLRCVADDETSTNNVLHFVTDGTVKLMISYRRSLYFIPLCLILKCLLNVTDLYIFKRLIEGRESDTYLKSSVKTMLQAVHIEGINTHEDAKRYVGKTFRVKFSDKGGYITDEQICDALIQRSLAIHLKENVDKFNLLVFMTQKLFAFIQGKCCEEGADAIMMQEVLTGGSIYQQVLKDKLQGCLNNLRIVISKKVESGNCHSITQNDMATFCKRAGTVQRAMENFIGTGNAPSHSSSLPQEKGLSILAENINRMRYMSHFKSIHRGSFFVEMRTTEARQLLPDAWGFICPVHTPDGAPCGLLNHLSKECQVTGSPDPAMVDQIPEVLFSLGVLPLGTHIPNYYDVLLNGRVIGIVPSGSVLDVAKHLRLLKVEGIQIPNTTEIIHVPKKEFSCQYPGLFLFTGPCRLVRPVINLNLNKTELVGTFEQVYLDICLKLDEAYDGLTTHQELSQTSFLSNLACLIPMPDCNQSPRNMYQCQMGKQSMGTPVHTWEVQAETKLYRLLMPSSPLFRPAHYDTIELDDFPMGMNAIVAVISYTGYDMEDAMIINKSAYERGFGHGSILKSEFYDLTPGSYFERDPAKADLAQKLDEDGLPQPGSLIQENDPICCYFDDAASKYVVEKFHGKEIAYIDNVRLCCGLTADSARACITFRVPRNPTVGDKFASRAGQKGICSQLWAAEDLPFTESGMVPDVVFNPHGFPSRMTIAMMIELMAGKSAAVHGMVHDATPFRFSKDDSAIDYFGKLLEAAGYNYYGTEKMYSGVNGREMKAAIFYGVVYYQRLRHMVLDKWQVRSTGAVDTLTQQPIKGRRRGGGVRFGEMERDSLISHGASALVNDRLFECSDKYKTLICVGCNSLLSTALSRCPKSGVKKEVCRLCPNGGNVKSIEIPYIFRYLLIQLAAVNINIKVFT
ncbi:hypothetical protein RUM44_008154 [Polyplax serrata]|uniref:DNA-directed RNA polymerase subunit beta n=1 Tax=Polyplax serrata TaxID=468196 RepID=A0ABR1BBH9_POLSC